MTEKNYRLTLDAIGNRDPAYLETIFSLGNGHFGIRAGDVLTPSATAGTIINGLYETAPIQYGEAAYGYAANHQTTVALPDLRVITIQNAAGEAFVTNALGEKTLDLRSGQLQESWLATDPNGATIQVQLTSVLQQPAGNLAALTYTVTAVTYTGKLTLAKTLKMPPQAAVSGDPRQARHLAPPAVHLAQPDAQTLVATIRTRQSRQVQQLQLAAAQGLTFAADLVPGAGITYPVVAVVNALNDESRLGLNVPVASLTKSVATAAKRYWQGFWAHSDASIQGDFRLDLAIHYNLFQLASAAGQDGKTNIAAKGLSGTGYEGHYFWDTEMYMLPFLTYTNPQIAKRLLEYRARILPQAQSRARLLGVDSGALFAWRTINGEEASAYFPAGTAQYHIDGDVAFAVDRYWQVTGDQAFMRSTGLQLLIATARFWAAFGSWSERAHQQTFEFFAVTGPDEYTALVNNNYYTNRIAKFNLATAAQLAAEFPTAAAQWQVTATEIADWRHKAAAVFLPYSDDLQINEQDDSAFHKPVWPFAQTPKDHYPLLLHYHPLTIYRYQVNKQADTLLADYLFDDLDAAQLQREYAYYESITTHDSSLSRSIFSALAARLGQQEKAYRYFMDTAAMDLVDLQQNAADGLHIANLGGSWLSLATGFGGLAIKSGVLSVTNHLPRQWQSLTLRVQIQGRLLQITYRPKKHR
ncbi:glycoside hydrolase family 65 protein [Lacticaseibacillus baoqingensis]|uniref:Glycoside hydrolase family 65 protein n=2 Tax=Lacticaseibacillus baoqingensis TaxID=2486013 RepID=A0ABW4EAF8_9LACO|nr:glycoside hydrolase family 65 protein [Lacticaseibacillus baoqingensis]